MAKKENATPIDAAERARLIELLKTPDPQRYLGEKHSEATQTEVLQMEEVLKTLPKLQASFESLVKRLVETSSHSNDTVVHVMSDFVDLVKELISTSIESDVDGVPVGEFDILTPFGAFKYMRTPNGIFRCGYQMPQWMMDPISAVMDKHIPEDMIDVTRRNRANDIKDDNHIVPFGEQDTDINLLELSDRGEGFHIEWNSIKIGAVEYTDPNNGDSPVFDVDVTSTVVSCSRDCNRTVKLKVEFGGRKKSEHTEGNDETFDIAPSSFMVCVDTFTGIITSYDLEGYQLVSGFTISGKIVDEAAVIKAEERDSAPVADDTDTSTKSVPFDLTLEATGAKFNIFEVLGANNGQFAISRDSLRLGNVSYFSGDLDEEIADEQLTEGVINTCDFDGDHEVAIITGSSLITIDGIDEESLTSVVVTVNIETGEVTTPGTSTERIRKVALLGELTLIDPASLETVELGEQSPEEAYNALVEATSASCDVDDAAVRRVFDSIGLTMTPNQE